MAGEFKQYCEHIDFVTQVLNEFNGVPSSQAGTPITSTEKWSATKGEVLQMWKNLRGDIPIVIMPVADPTVGKSKSTYAEDGIRITGSWYFISSVLSRLKELTMYENPQTKLRLVFRGVDKAGDSRPDRQAFVFYLNLEKRKRQKTNPVNKTPQLPV